MSDMVILESLAQSIAEATDQQSTASEEVTQTMESISSITKRASDSREQIKISAVDLARLPSELKTMTAWFKRSSGIEKPTF